MDILLLGSTLRGELADKARALLTTRRMNGNYVHLMSTFKNPFWKEFHNTFIIYDFGHQINLSCDTKHTQKTGIFEMLFLIYQYTKHNIAYPIVIHSRK